MDTATPNQTDSNRSLTELETMGSPGFNQRDQILVGSQTNVAQAYAPVNSTVFQAPVYFGMLESIEWDKVNYNTYLDQVMRRFANHMRNFAGAETDDEAWRRYVPLRFEMASPQKYEKSGESELRADLKVVKPELGTWDELVKYPQIILLVGNAGAGKTTLLLHEAGRLAKTALRDPQAPLPVYLSLKTYTGGTHNALLEMAAKSTGFETKVFYGLWREGRRPVCLFLDSADEVSLSQIHSFVQALEEMTAASGSAPHSIIIACRPGDMRDELKRCRLNFYEINSPPLGEADVRSLLHNYGLAELVDHLDSGLRELLQTPDILSALTQCLPHTGLIELPHNIGQIYQLYVEHRIFKNAQGQYDYWRVKRPVLAWLAYALLKQEENHVVHSEELDQQLIEQLTGLSEKYLRRRQIMPEGWTVEGLLQELDASPAIERSQMANGDSIVSFSKSGYRDYFAAVYLSEFYLRSSELEALAPRLRQPRWLQLLIILAGIEPEARALFDRVYASEPQLAADLWFENHPRGIEAPAIIRGAYEQQKSNLESAPSTQLDEPITERLLARMLDSRSPAKRLQAVNAISQWGLSAVTPLFDAAQDDQPLIQTAAQYALLRLGEPSGDNGRPLGPLVAVENSQFVFSAESGCNAQIGPLYLVRVPPNVKATINVVVENLDFDPFAAESAFTLWHTSPAWFIEKWFGQRQEVDWIGLAVRCDRIVELSTRLASQAERYTSLASLTTQLRLRAAHYEQLCRHLARDLGLSRRDVLTESESDEIKAEAEKLFRRLRYAYCRSRRSHLLGTDSKPGNHDIRVNQSIELMESGAGVFALSSQRFGFDVASSSSEDFSQTSLAFNQAVERMTDGLLTGCDIEELCDEAEPIPHRLQIVGNMAVENASESTITGVKVQNLYSKGGGFTASLNLVIKHFDTSRLFGILVQDAKIVE